MGSLTERRQKHTAPNIEFLGDYGIRSGALQRCIQEVSLYPGKYMVAVAVRSYGSMYLALRYIIAVNTLATSYLPATDPTPLSDR